MAESSERKADRAQGPELRLIDRRAFVGFPELKVAPGVRVIDFALQIPDVTFPFNVSGGASKYQRKKLDFGFLELEIDAEVVARRVHELAGKLADLDDLKLHFRPGYLEAQGRLRGGDRAALTFKIAFDGDGDSLAVYLYDVRFYAFAATPASRLPAIVADAVKELEVLPEVQRRGANGFSTRLLPPLVEAAAVARGFKMPSLDNARLVEASVSSKGLRLRFAAGGLPPPATPDEELLLTLEGARAFSDAEEALAHGRLEEARAQYLKLGDANEAHPFAVERLLTLLVADPTAHELALDIAQSLQGRRDKSATALWAEAVVRERRGEFARAAERYLALCNLARKNQEEAGAFFAAEAGARAGRDHAPQMAAKALHELLGIKPDHLPSLKALARASDQAKDRAGAMRAYRRLAALARDPLEAADAHVQLARLAAQTEDDVAGARLHCEAALRLAPDHPDALMQLSELCFQSGEHLRAIKSVDRLREVAMARHEVDRIGRANVLAGKVWELGLKQPENALLRYREAASLLPGEPEPLYFTARVAESLNKLQESVSGYVQTIELAGPAPRTEEIRTAAHASHHALARLYKTKLGEPARARDHLEAALQLQPTDLTALDELLPYYRASGKAAELADAAEKAASVLEDPHRRAALWAEAGELYRGRLAQPDKADRLLGQALEADPKNRIALEGMLALAESRRDGGQLCRCLRALAELAEDAKERVRYFRRLAVAARDLAFDLDLAAYAYTEVLKVEREDLPALGELCALQRRRSDWAGLSWALEQRSIAAEAAGDKRLAAACLRELSQVQEARLGRAGEALVALEKAARLFPEANTLLELANLSLRCERPLNARRALEDVLALLPKHASPERLAEVRARLGRACDLLGDKDGARENYAMAFPLRRLDDELAGRLEQLYEEAAMVPELTDLWASRAQALLQAGRGQDAAPLFFKSAQSLLRAGDTAGAVLRLSAALDAAPQGERAAETLEAMAELELNRGEKLEAAKLFARRAGLESDARGSARLFYRAASLSQGTAREEGYLASALQQDLSFIPARLRRAELQLQSDPKTALLDLEAVLEADPKDPDVAGAHLDRLALLRKAGFAALASGQLDSGRRLLGLYVAQKPEDIEATQELASLHRKSGAIEPLVDLLAELWPRLEGPPRKAARREYAEGSLSLGRADAAIEVLRAILVDEPQDTWAATKLLTLLPGTEETMRERSTLISRLIDSAKGEERAQLLARRSELHRQLGDLIAARSDLLDAAQLAEHPLWLLKQLAALARETRDEVGEISAWKLVLGAVRPDDAFPKEAYDRLMELARTRQSSGDQAHAREAYELVVPLTAMFSPTERHEAWYGLARTALGSGDRARAEVALLEASKAGPAPSRVAALLERAQLLEGREARAEAVTAYEAALALAPRHPQATEGLKRTLRAVQDFEGLAEVLATEAAAAPKAKAAPLYRELFHLYSEQLEAHGPAEAALRKVVELDESDLSARAHLASILAERGELEESTQLLEQAAEGMPAADAARLLREGAQGVRKAGDQETALRLLRKAHAREAAKGPALVELAELLFLLGAVEEALPLQEQVTQGARFDDDPEGAELAFIRLADLAEQTKDLALAETALRRVVKERPLSQPAVERLAGLVAERSPREALGIQADWASRLSRSPKAAAELLDLARRARTEVADVDLASTLYGKAAEASEKPLPIRDERAALLREAGKSGELMQELLEIAVARHAGGDVEGALAAWEEEAGLAEGLSRVDEALRTLQAMAEVCEEEGMMARASSLMRRRAELLTDSKLDLDGAQEALEKAWDYSEDVETARRGIELSRRRSDREAEIDWLERSMKSIEAPPERADAFVQLAKLHLGGDDVAGSPLLAPDQAEASLKEALKEMPGHAGAEGALIELYERQDRLGDVAAYYEETALRARSTAERARLLLRAAELYKDRANKPHEAAAAYLAARAANPDDAELTAKVADQLHALGRVVDAADFDALLLEKDPFHPAFERHKQYLKKTEDEQALAALLMRRAQAEVGEAAAATWLEASQAFLRAGAPERARLCEDQAFEAAPTNDEAFEALKVRAKEQPRRLADLLAARARAKPNEASERLRERAAVLQEAREALAAAAAWDEYLQVAPDDLEALEERAGLAADAGGPKAAQPFDRRLIQLGGEKLSEGLRHTLWMRLGKAALESEAWRDAADAFEQAFQLQGGGEPGKEALSLLAEAASRARDNVALYRTSLRLAERSEGAEEEALYRRAAALFDEPTEVIDALRWLTRNRPAEEDLYQRTTEALSTLGRHGELLEVHERYAGAAGGTRGASALLEAAELAESELKDEAKAQELRREASRLDPDNVVALAAVVAEQRQKSDEAGLLTTLPRLADALASSDLETANGLKLELAGLLEKKGELAGARVTLGAIRSGGASAPGYGAALEALERILKKQNNTAALADVLAARAELSSADQRSQLLLRAAYAAKASDDLVKAVELTRSSLQARATSQGLLLLSELSKVAGQTGTAATALVQAALLSDAIERPKLLLDAVQLWEDAGEKDEALGVLHRLRRDHPDALTRAELAQRMLKLGAKQDALEVAFTPAMEAEDFDEALEWADQAQDEARIDEALWAIAERDGDAPKAQRLAARLRAASAVDQLPRLARLLGEGGAELWLEVFVERGDGEALDQVEKLGRLESAAEGALKSPTLPKLEALLPKVEGLPAPLRERLWRATADASEERRPKMLEALSGLYEGGERWADAAKALGELAALEEDAGPRRDLQLKRGGILRAKLNRPDLARDAYEQALGDDPNNLDAVAALLQLYSDQGGAQFVAMADKLQALAGDAGLTPYREKLAVAYEEQGRKKEALASLAALPETPERLERRAALAADVGMTGEALQLREKLAETDAERREVLAGYLKADLVPFAVRLGERLLDEKALQGPALRLLAERLAPTEQGAALSVRAWPLLLNEKPSDADGWTLFSEALQRLGRGSDAELADGFGAALTSSNAASPVIHPEQVDAPDAYRFPELPEGLLPVTEQSMPRLSLALYDALGALGAKGMTVVLDPLGGVEAWQGAPQVLVLGAGALAVFGPSELTYLCALALALGEGGHRLREPGQVPGFDEAAVSAFEAYPVSLAAGRVLAHLDSRVRGTDPSALMLNEVLPDNAEFRAVARKALEILQQ
jgi:tetratricopeptide (TPR) repeat protein